ncbi:MAG TPA: YlxM family DNA-binding protein [Tissierellaceae bacterium]|nr:YlxM family DNA-binding protein [Tissierellaceae bacterium]
MIEKMIKFGTLFDFYGNLLSVRQYNVMEMFYLQDLSLSEIGIELNITRQGVYDNLKRAEDNLNRYEDILGLVEKFKENHKDIEKILNIAKDINKIAITKNDIEILNKTKVIKDISFKILENSWEVID